jgi:4-amino-4-deoxy-L-arabinose transferase-like glycosyltransferase
VLALGVLLRVRQYAGRRSLWLDELSVALNLASRDFLDLLRPLDYNQAAPVLFLWVQELATRVGGFGELSLRFAPLLCGVALLPVAWLAARRLLEPWAAVCAVLLLAVSPLLVWHANEVKPYAGDALASAVMLVLALRTLDAPTDAARWRWLLIGGIVALLGSTPAVFVLGGVALALLLEPAIRRSAAALRRTAGTLVAWAGTFVVVYLAFYRPVAQSGFMQRYWQEEFLRIDATLPGRLWREATRLIEAAFLPYVEGSALTVAASIGVALTAIGVVYVGRRHGVSRAVLLVTPLALAGLASLLRRYPLEPRLFLFAVPPLALLLLEGVSAFEVRRAPTLRLVGFAALFGISVLSASWRLVRRPMHREETRTVVEEYERKTRGEPVLIFGHGIKSWVYYTLDWNRMDSTRLQWPKRAGTPLVGNQGVAYGAGLPGAGMPVRAGWDAEGAERTRQVASPCAWLFFAHYREPQVDTLIDAIAEAGGSVRREASALGAQLHRACFDVDLAGTPEDTATTTRARYGSNPVPQQTDGER